MLRLGFPASTIGTIAQRPETLPQLLGAPAGACQLPRSGRPRRPPVAVYRELAEIECIFPGARQLYVRIDVHGRHGREDGHEPPPFEPAQDPALFPLHQPDIAISHVDEADERAFTADLLRTEAR